MGKRLSTKQAWCLVKTIKENQSKIPSIKDDAAVSSLLENPVYKKPLRKSITVECRVLGTAGVWIVAQIPPYKNGRNIGQFLRQYSYNYDMVDFNTIAADKSEKIFVEAYAHNGKSGLLRPVSMQDNFWAFPVWADNAQKVASFLGSIGAASPPDLYKWLLDTEDLKGQPSQAAIVGDRIAVVIPDDPILFSVLKYVYNAEIDDRCVFLPLDSYYANVLLKLSEHINLSIEQDIMEMARYHDVYSILEKRNYRIPLVCNKTDDLVKIIGFVKKSYEVFEIKSNAVTIHGDEKTQYTMEEFINDQSLLFRARKGVVVLRSMTSKFRSYFKTEFPRIIALSGFSDIYNLLPDKNYIEEEYLGWTNSDELWDIAYGVVKVTS